jgi:hypothetical protein
VISILVLDIGFAHQFPVTELLAPGCPIRALASDTFPATRLKKRIGRWIVLMLRSLFPCCEHFFHVANRDASNIQRVCVANVLRACCERGYVQHPTSGVFLPSSPHVATMLRLYCDHVATRVVCNIQHQELSLPPPQHKNQHHMSATSILNIRNIKI